MALSTPPTPQSSVEGRDGIRWSGEEERGGKKRRGKEEEEEEDGEEGYWITAEQRTSEEGREDHRKTEKITGKQRRADGEDTIRQRNTRNLHCG